MVDFSEDLQFVADRVTDALNIFNKMKVTESQLIIAYTDQDFIALTIRPQEDHPELGTMNLRTRDMAASWKNVPVGFSQINQSRGLLEDMKRAAHPSLKKNGLWYIDKQIKDVIGDMAEVAEVKANKGFKYNLKLTNGYSCNIIMNKDELEYKLPHEAARLYALTDNNGNILSDFMTADACVLKLLNMAMMTDIRAAKFIEVVGAMGGKAKTTHSYRLQDETLDEVKGVFSNGYAVTFKITNSGLFIDMFSQYQGEMYELDNREFRNMDEVFAYIDALAQEPPFIPDPANFI